MKYGSVCSGIEAASKAWEPLDWKPAWFSEIEPFPSAVLAHHWPEVTNLGDMTKIADAVRAGEVEAPDVLVGGTPCQAFSIAGLREGLSDDRGQLTLSYVELANAIDAKRRERGEPEAIIVWENVPGVLSSKDNAFGCFLAGLAGESSELQPAGGKWTHAGCVSGPERAIAWRVLDAQFFGVAQRRRRVFVVASARKDFDSEAVLFELNSVRRDTAPRREAGERIAESAGHCLTNGSHWDGGNYPHPTLNQSNNIGGIGQSNQEIFSQRGAGLVGAYRMVAFGEYADDETASTCKARDYKDATDLAVAYGIPGNWIGREPKNGGNAVEPMHNIAPCQTRTDIHGVAFGFSVRRLTPIECERLQGFPDGHTLVEYRGRPVANGHRYKAIGNSMAVPVMRWIGERISAALPVEAPVPRNWQRPFLKWAGGKYSLLPELDRLIPAGKRLIEPFVGGGSVFLNSEKHESFLLADVNADLINLYQMLEVDHIRVCSLAKILFERANSEVAYKELRDEFNNQRMGAPERAAAFLFLNRHCFNGLIRYNRDGFFNVGWGKYEAPYFPEIEIKTFKQKSHKCVFLNAGYRRTLALAGEGDVVYCDPPYEPLPGTAGFTNYAAGGFSWADQISLAESCVAAHQRGAKVLISNSTAPRVLELYEQHGFILHHVDARRAISSKGSTRETAKDIVATLGV
ncbi:MULTISPECIES: Dam family site-specific DNA-(adenine-N6)-methyltransferase [Enterobacter]|uniref:Dam family site-specific DNA-(adenine-N6)-methyltransferase n=1 Tax=Enterobacter hormaechei TaxID=158836 RepID=UPI000EF9BF9C|nr:Dam family site-specific DNA-(adenine-N6)-methyltransferase [Enterobacter hormaechei]EKV5086772.1 Dam family site-specific DNA-(adenine-N6)-methyltransferase [Enterobacter hormaechei]RMA02710.1 Dam family site-specific DNA-(adenine-N6)-methyltransferase [Enterobacter hormaechei subsp. hoffmannii]